MNVIEISSGKFREKQKTFFELVDKGTRLIIKRGENRTYEIIPANVEELHFSPEMERRIDQATQNIKDGKGETYTADQIDRMLGL